MGLQILGLELGRTEKVQEELAFEAGQIAPAAVADTPFVLDQKSVQVVVGQTVVAEQDFETAVAVLVVEIAAAELAAETVVAEPVAVQH